MWKSLRIGALLALAAVGALKLAQYEAAQSQIEHAADAMASKVRLGYASVSGALDGRIVLESPRFEVLAGPAKGAVLRADRATIEAPGTFWLLQRIVGGDSAVPSSLDVRFEGASISDDTIDRYGRDGWFGPASLVPFESVGCDPVAAFSMRDYARMGVALRPREGTLHYAYDAGSRTLRADIDSTAPPFSTISARIELSAFEPAAWLGDARAARATRIEQFSLTYLDGGYLASRNRFCAQLTGTDAAGYAARHLVAVRAFLDAHGVKPGEEVMALYGKLLTDGGSVELSSLPDAAFVPAEFAAEPPDDLLRQLNVTLRHNTAPPILMRLAFVEPSSTTPAATATDEAMLAAAPVPSPPPESTAVVAPEPESAVVADEPASSAGMPLLSVAHAAPVPAETVPIDLPRIALPVAPGEDAAAPEPTSPWTSHPEVDPRDAVEAVPASAPPPPPGSTDALVWRAPTIERLPPRTTFSEYVSIPAASLASRVGTRVRLLTAGGKIVEGRLQKVDGTDAVLLVLRDGGSAQMRIPAAGIRDVMVRRATSP